MAATTDEKLVNGSNRRQFSLRQAMILLSVIGAILALPGGALLLGYMASWIGVAVIVLTVLMAIQLPLLILVKLWFLYDDAN